MIKKNLLFLFFSVCFLANAQYTNVINSNRPGFSESPYSVGTGIYQLEMGLFYKASKIVPTFTRPESFGTNILFRTSFFLEKIEFNVNIAYQRDKVAFKNVFTSHYFAHGLSKLTIGAKYLVYQPKYADRSKEIRSWKRRHAYDWKRVIPSVAIYAGLNTDALNPIYQTGGMTPKAGVLLQNNLSEDFNIVTNFYYDYIGSDYSELSYIITATYNLNNYWSTFLEQQATFKTYRNDYNIGTGIAYLFSKNFQVNASTRMTFEGEATGFYTGLGFSFRLDRHRDSYRMVDTYGNKLTPTIPLTGKKKKIIGRFFNFFKFKKSKKTGSKTRKRPIRKRKKTTSKSAKKRKRKSKKKNEKDN